MRSRLAILMFGAALIGGSGLVFSQQPAPSAMNAIAERYVKLVLAVGQHDADYVDAFYGPAEWKTEAERRKLPLREIDAAAERLIADLSPLW